MALAGPAEDEPDALVEFELDEVEFELAPPVDAAFAVAVAPVAPALPDFVEFDEPPLTLPVAVVSAAAAVSVDFTALVLEADED